MVPFPSFRPTATRCPRDAKLAEVLENRVPPDRKILPIFESNADHVFGKFKTTAFD
jgi:hypothetical protein